MYYRLEVAHCFTDLDPLCILSCFKPVLFRTLTLHEGTFLMKKTFRVSIMISRLSFYMTVVSWVILFFLER